MLGRMSALMANTKQILLALTSVDGINTAVCVGRDGFVIDSKFVNNKINCLPQKIK